MSLSVKNKQIVVTTDFDINTHRLTNVVDPTSDQDAATKFYVDTVVGDVTIPLNTITGITSNTSLGSLTSGLTLGMMYITNSGTVTAEVNLGTTPTGNEINPYDIISIPAGEILSITINRRLSDTITNTLYISASSWTNVTLKVEWAEITYQNQSGGGGGVTALSSLTDVSLGTLNDNDILTYQTSNGKWTNLPSGGGSTTSLSTALSSEISTRISNDTSLSTVISVISGSTLDLNDVITNGQVLGMSSNLFTGVTYQTITSSVSSSLSSEISTRTSSDTSLSTAISNLVFTKSVGIIIDGGGSVITTGSKGYRIIESNYTVSGWTLLSSGATGSIVIDVRKTSYSTFPTSTSIAGTEKPTLSSVNKNQDNVLTTWTTTLSQNDMLEFVVESVTDVTNIWLFIDLISI